MQTKRSASRRGRNLEDQVARRTMVLEGFSVGILLLDEGGAVTYMNPALRSILGGEAVKLAGSNVREVSWGAWDGDLRAPLLKTILTGRPWHGFLLRREGETEKEWGARISPLTGEGGKISGYILTMRDATEERKIEARLRQVQKMEALGNLARGIAHDLRNIFSPITVNTELLLGESGKEPRERAYLEQILRAARRGRQLVDQITVFARGGEGEKRVVGLGSLIEDTLKILRPTLPPDVELDVRLATRKDRILANPSGIHQVLMNLIGNAVQAMSAGGGRLTVVLEPAGRPKAAEDDAGTYLQLRIRDTGPGIPAEVTERIFEPFFTTKEGGSGMGLAVVHGIVTDLGGAIAVDSEPDRGAEFRIILPRAESGARRSNRRRTAKRGPEGRA